MSPKYIGYDETIGLVSWNKAVDALHAGHQMPKADIADIFLGPNSATLLSRAAYISGIGYGVKSVTVMESNAAVGLPTVQGAMTLFDDRMGKVSAIIDSRLITEIKTASDSVLGARLLARPDSRKLLIMGAGVVAKSLVRAYSAVFPSIEEIAIWARRPDKAEEFINSIEDCQVSLSVAYRLDVAAGDADIISTATMARTPVLMGDWISPGTHVDLIGAFKADMREADDTLIGKGSLFVDSRETTIDHIGELIIPIANGVIQAENIIGDFYDLIAADTLPRRSKDDITVFKNGGGAHLDLMIANYLVKLAADSSSA